MKVVFTYKVSDKVINDELIKTGKAGMRDREFAVEMEQLSESARKELVELTNLQFTNSPLLDYSGRPASELKRSILVFSATLDKYYGPKIEGKDVVFEFATITQEQAEQAITRMLAERKVAEGEFSRIEADYKKQKRIEEETNAKERAERDAIDAARKEREDSLKEKAEAEKKEWIEKNGSDYLKRAFAAGYNSQRKYVTERAAKEFPSFELDFDDNAEWKARSVPSEEALDLADKYDGAEIVWMTVPPHSKNDEEYEYEEYEECEAVVIRKYLGRYDLVCTL